MRGCDHHCGNSTYRVLGPAYNTPSWIKWMRDHGVPVSQVPIHGSWAVRNVAAKQVVVLVYDWNEDDEIRVGDAQAPCHVYRDGDDPTAPELRMRAFVSQLDREPDPFPTSSALCSLTADEYEHQRRAQFVDAA